MIVLGLTGSIAMGKTTIGTMMRHMGIPVHESDKAVHALFDPDSHARPLLAEAFPYYEYPKIYNRKTGEINRKLLGEIIFADDIKRQTLEDIMHPLVREAQDVFKRECRQKKCEIACLDIPLLFETGAEKRVDYTLTASAPAAVQKQRALARPNMTEEKLNAVLERQISDHEKCKRSDYIIKTGLGMAHTLKDLKTALDHIREKENLPLDERDCLIEDDSLHFKYGSDTIEIETTEWFKK